MSPQASHWGRAQHRPRRFPCYPRTRMTSNYGWNRLTFEYHNHPSEGYWHHPQGRSPLRHVPFHHREAYFGLSQNERWHLGVWGPEVVERLNVADDGPNGGHRCIKLVLGLRKIISLLRWSDFWYRNNICRQVLRLNRGFFGCVDDEIFTHSWNMSASRKRIFDLWRKLFT